MHSTVEPTKYHLCINWACKNVFEFTDARII